MHTNFATLTARDYETWKRGLIERIGILTEKAQLLEQKVDLLEVRPVEGICQAHIKFLVSDSAFGQQTYMFTIARSGRSEYRVFTPADFVASHEDGPGMTAGYTLDDPDSGWIDRFLVDLGSNCQVDGEIEIENFLPRQYHAYWLQ